MGEIRSAQEARALQREIAGGFKDGEGDLLSVMTLCSKANGEERSWRFRVLNFIRVFIYPGTSRLFFLRLCRLDGPWTPRGKKRNQFFFSFL
jgi:hypothetical protein